MRRSASSPDPRRQPALRLHRDNAPRRGQAACAQPAQREFKTNGPNQLWVADRTYLPTWAGFIHLAVMLDTWSWRVGGWAIRQRMTAELVLSALNMALQQRKPERDPPQLPGQLQRWGGRPS